MLETLLLAGVVVAAATAGAVVAGLGGAVLIVPALLLAGFEPAPAASLGLLATAVASMAAAPRHLAERLVNHRLAVVIEVGAVAGAVAGALLAARLSVAQFRTVLAAAVALAAATAFLRRGVRNRPDPALGPDDVGERVGATAGAYPLGAAVVPYSARRVPLGMACAALIGAVAGVTGTSGGYLKTPLMSELMHVPSKVAAATTTFAAGITSASALLVYLGHGVLAPEAGAVTVLAALLGGAAGARLQALVPPPVVRRVLAALLVAVAGVLLWAR